jgi:hypothetical protein
VVVPGLGQPELSEDVVHVLLDGSLRHPQLMGDPGVRTSLGHQREHLPLPRAEHVERILDAARGDKLLDERRIDDRAALDDPIDGVDELLDVGHPALQEIAAALAARQQVHRVIDLHVGGEEEDRRLRKLLPDHACRFEAFGRVPRRHSDVDDREVGLVLAHEVDQLRPAGALTDDLVARPLEHARYPFAKEDVVVGQDDAHVAHRTALAPIAMATAALSASLAS